MSAKHITNKATCLKIGLTLIVLLILVVIFSAIFSSQEIQKIVFFGVIFFSAIIYYLIRISEEWQQFIFDTNQVKIIRLGFGLDGYKTYAVKYKSYQKAFLSEDKILTLKTNEGKRILEMPLATDFSEKQLEDLLTRLNHNPIDSDGCFKENINHKTEKRRLEI